MRRCLIKEPSRAGSGIWSRLVLGFPAVTLLWLLVPAPLAGQSPEELRERWVLDKYSLSVSGRFNSLDTKFRVDSEELGVGTEIDAEDFLGLDTEDTNWDIQGEIRLGRNHVLSGQYADFVREHSRVIDREITIGESVFPINADVRTEFDIETISFSYRYYPWVEETWALGFGLGLRWYDFAIDVEADEVDRREDSSVSAPMPFAGTDLRFALSDRFRLHGSAGFFDVELGDLGGNQILAEAALEYLVLPYLAVGAGFDIGAFDGDADGENWSGAIDSDVYGLRLFAKLRS